MADTLKLTISTKHKTISFLCGEYDLSEYDADGVILNTFDRLTAAIEAHTDGEAYKIDSLDLDQFIPNLSSIADYLDLYYSNGEAVRAYADIQGITNVGDFNSTYVGEFTSLNLLVSDKLQELNLIKGEVTDAWFNSPYILEKLLQNEYLTKQFEPNGPYYVFHRF